MYPRGAETLVSTSTESDTALITHWIEPNPHKSGSAEAWIGEYGVSVWALIGYLELNDWDADVTANDYRLPKQAVQVAIAYYKRNRTVIDARITTNRAAFMA